MTFNKAIKQLTAEYEKAKQLEYIRNPLAFALHKVWKMADKENKVGNESKPNKVGS